MFGGIPFLNNIAVSTAQRNTMLASNLSLARMMRHEEDADDEPFMDRMYLKDFESIEFYDAVSGKKLGRLEQSHNNEEVQA